MEEHEYYILDEESPTNLQNNFSISENKYSNQSKKQKKNKVKSIL